MLLHIGTGYKTCSDSAALVFLSYG